MSFFDENIDEIEQVIEEQESSVTSFEPDSLIGSVVYYDPERFKFMVANADGSTFINANNISDWRTIMIGTVIGDNADKTVDVLMCGFLMAEPLYLPRMYHDPSKQKYIRNYAISMFRRYVSAFFKKVPAYNELSRLNITLPTVSEMRMIQDRYPDIFESMKVVSDLHEFGKYVNRMFNNYLYVMHNNKMYMMKINEDKSKPDIIYPDVGYDGDFLCVFRKISLAKPKNENIEDGQANEQFFG